MADCHGGEEDHRTSEVISGDEHGLAVFCSLYENDMCMEDFVQ